MFFKRNFETIMLEFNYLVIFITALIPLIVGMVWYHPKAFGTIWFGETGLKKEDTNNSKMGKVFLITFLLSILYSVAMHFQVIHQLHFKSMLMNEVGFSNGEGEAFEAFVYNMKKYGQNFRTFGHGAFHGFLNSIFIVLPIIAINAMFELKSWKYIMINWGYWAVCSTIMGGIICQFM